MVIHYNQSALAWADKESGAEPVNGIPKERKATLPFRRKILYYGLMLLLTLLVLEGMGRLAYYAAYGQGYGRGGSADPVDFTPPLFPLYPAILLSISSRGG